MRRSRYGTRQSGSRSTGRVEPSVCMTSAPVEGASASGGGSSDGPSAPLPALVSKDG
jgi:hypothetical protein